MFKIIKKSQNSQQTRNRKQLALFNTRYLNKANIMINREILKTLCQIEIQDKNTHYEYIYSLYTGNSNL